MTRHKTTPEAAKLLLEGQMALAGIENNGVRVDRGYLDGQLTATAARIKEYQEEMAADKEVYPVWKRTYGDRTNIGSRDQIGKVIFGQMGHKAKAETATGRAKADRGALEAVDLPFVKLFLKAEELKKARSTYLEGIRREMVETEEGWFIHPSYNANTVRTFRLSCSLPNFQNIPVRNPEIAEIIRRCYIPRKGRHFVEIDYSQIEVRVSVCYHHDPNLIKYIKDKSTDMHRDMAAQIYMVKPGEVTKECRHAAKNQFVFPQFYGSVYFQCAPALWEAATRRNLTVGKDGIPLIEHLRSKGVTELGACDPQQEAKRGTFEYHLKKVEEDFWGRRFRVYQQWKRDWYEAYRRAGGFMTKCGFWIGGLMGRNDVLNYGIQGDASNCMVWSIIRIIKKLRKYKMKSCPVGLIHDSKQGDVVPAELDNYLNLCHETMVEELPKAWDWIGDIPLETESEVSPLGKSWHEKKQYVESDGKWSLKT